MNGKVMTLLFYKVKVEDTGDVTLGKEESVLDFTFRAFYDEDEEGILEHSLT
jgi:hypothetical protein